jgi:hypothetical protein
MPHSLDLQLPLEDSPYGLDDHGPVFIVGCPRSGTTFLAESIAAIRSIEYFSGAIVPPRVMHLLGSNAAQGLDNTQLLLVVRDILWQALWRRRLAKSERFVQWVKGNQSLASALQTGRMRNFLLCYKEPFLCFALREVAEHFSNSRFIHILRDGRDNADSLERTYPDALSDRVLGDPLLAQNKSSEIGLWRMHDGRCVPWWVANGEEAKFLSASRYTRCVWMWKEMVSHTLDAGQTLGPQRYLELRYESVVADPTEAGRKVLEFLGLRRESRFMSRLQKAYHTSVAVSRQRQPQERLEEADAIAAALLSRLQYH